MFQVFKKKNYVFSTHFYVEFHEILVLLLMLLF